MSFTAASVLAALDRAFKGLPAADFTTEDPNTNTYIFFLDLEHGYCNTAGSRIHLFADAFRWSVVFEKCGYNNRGNTANTELVYVGNCINYSVEVHNGRTSVSNMNTIVLISGEEWERIHNTGGEESEDYELIPTTARSINVRGAAVEIEHNPDKYRAAGIFPEAEENPKNLMSYGGFVRFLYETNPSLMQATEAELKACIPKDLPKILTLDAFHFSSAYDADNPPSAQETFQLIAKVLVTQNPDFWKPALLPNNHWSNWESGNL